ncbi:type III-B CRISPR module-associated protein Cmr5 [Dictyobacter arantiisoli]|uniref:CRISPR type III-B/RAMP module-associated protein Cmr5 n=1 Tax=Dictyobacter arantiisoli TaxID=2014874 RepID=A0A5A5TJU4_9CHLR|nr:type III-B CRISPR module-associated protein Cmr5 [Dictyobacter arantiisoli]GCF11707.1 hypothetical protein KDI_52710 [Dictyobacter arantiisoli]
MSEQQLSGTRKQNSEQRRGRHAWTSIQEIKGLTDKSHKEREKKYRSLARGFNAMLQINGLGQTFGFICAKSKPDKQKSEVRNEYYYFAQHITNWMKENFRANNIAVMEKEQNGFLTWIIDNDTTSADYRRATTECLALGVWLRRFAEAELEGEEA